MYIYIYIYNEGRPQGVARGPGGPKFGAEDGAQRSWSSVT